MKSAFCKRIAQRAPAEQSELSLITRANTKICLLCLGAHLGEATTALPTEVLTCFLQSFLPASAKVWQRHLISAFYPPSASPQRRRCPRHTPKTSPRPDHSVPVPSVSCIYPVTLRLDLHPNCWQKPTTITSYGHVSPAFTHITAHISSSARLPIFLLQVSPDLAHYCPPLSFTSLMDRKPTF